MTTHLAEETSPYLLMHVNDPVDWYPWGDEALARARETNRPIFLSVGYASCHWCHVMQRESFGDPETAALLNERFVSIKVDRESRPDVDEFTMAYVVGVTGHGGWPTSVFLTPDLQPVFGGTYFPPERMGGMPSFKDVLLRVSRVVDSGGAELAEVGAEALSFLRATFEPQAPIEPTAVMLERTAKRLVAEADPLFGGFGRSGPKFPQAPVTDFLLAHASLTGHEPAFATVQAQVEGMVRGGIYDHVGGGIARYSVDEHWMVPHFEKMLYDNGQLLSTLAQVHEHTPRDEWRHAMLDTADWMERELRRDDGLYASSLGADTDGVEGLTYAWRFEELYDQLDPEELLLAQNRLGVTRGGNFDDSTNVLVRPDGRAEDAAAVDSLLGKLRRLRALRPQPERDDKAIVAWNALAARGLMDAGRVLDQPGLVTRGVRVVSTLLESAVAEDGTVRRLAGDPGSVSVLEDSAGLAVACIEAADASGTGDFIGHAQRILARARELFEGEPGVLYAATEDTSLPVRPREQHDNPTPTGASLIALAALRLGRLLEDEDLLTFGEAALGRMLAVAERSPFAAGTACAGACEVLAQRETDRLPSLR